MGLGGMDREKETAEGNHTKGLKRPARIREPHSRSHSTTVRHYIRTCPLSGAWLRGDMEGYVAPEDGSWR